MIIGHLPAGYVLSKVGYSRFRRHVGNYRTFMFWGLFGSLAPDLDMFYFHLVDHRHTHHHKYFTHYPILWLALIFGAALLCLSKERRERFGTYALVFAVAGFCHLILDTIVGDIWWFAPFIDKPFALANVPAVYHPWWLNFILHWSFMLEVAIVIWAGWLWSRGTGNEKAVDRKGRAPR